MGLIIRTCSVAAILAVLATPAFAKAGGASPLSDYALGRLASADGNVEQAANAFSSALTGAPDSGTVAQHSFQQAIEAGNERLALRAARALETLDELPADGRLLLFLDRLKSADWRGARLQLDKLESASRLGFMTPVLRAWTAFAARDVEPLPLLDGRPEDGLAISYSRDQRAILLLALGRGEEGLALSKSLLGSDGFGVTRRLLAAAKLLKLKDRSGALALLQNDGGMIKAARLRIEAGKPLPGAVETAREGAAMLFARVANDLVRDRAGPTALQMARLANFAAPNHDQTILTLAQALIADSKWDAALKVLDTIKPDSLLSIGAREAKVKALILADRHEQALAQAKINAARSDVEYFDYLSLAEANNRLQNYRDAAIAFEAAIAKLTTDYGKDVVPSSLWLRLGSALDAAHDWTRAKPALEKAVELGPDDPAALNHLGFALLDRGEAPDMAMRLIARASALRPDDAAITDSLGWAYFKRGKTDISIITLEKAMASDPTIAEIAEHLGDAYWTAGRKVEARYTWRAALIQSEGDADGKRIRAKIADGLAIR